MTTIFDAIAQSIGVALGADQATGGWVAGVSFSVVLSFILTWALMDKDDEKFLAVFFFFLVGIIISAIPVVGWIPLWVPFVIGIMFIFISIGPLSNKNGG